MARRIIIILALGSALVAGAVLCWGIRSYFVVSAWPVVVTHPGVSFQSVEGRFCIVWAGTIGTPAGSLQVMLQGPHRRRMPPARVAGPINYMIIGVPPAELTNAFGFGKTSAGVFSGMPPSGWSVIARVVPYGPIIAVLLMPLAILVSQRAWHGKAKRAGFCEACGYDLRATPERCPECGKPAAQLRELT